MNDPGYSMEAVHAAIQADVIVSSVYAADELPFNLYAWIAAWLPRRLLQAGALAALVGVAEPPDTQLVRTIDYLQAGALKAQLDFVPQVRRWAIASPARISLMADSIAANTIAAGSAPPSLLPLGNK